jgi:hypothetical protein
MTFKLNVSIDDITPHPLSSTKVLDRCFELMEIFPTIKFSLFIPMAYWRVNRPGTITDKPLLVSEYPDFCETLASLPEENFELGYHGLFHGKPLEGNDNDELYNITYEQSIGIIGRMLEEAEKAGLKDLFKPMLRPPCWKMSPQAFDAANELGIELFALTNIQNRLETYEGRNVKYSSVYSNCAPPNRKLEVTDRCGVVYHACEWLKNYLDTERKDELIEFINRDRQSVEFCFLDGLQQSEEQDGQK